MLLRKWGLFLEFSPPNFSALWISGIDAVEILHFPWMITTFCSEHCPYDVWRFCFVLFLCVSRLTPNCITGAQIRHCKKTICVCVCARVRTLSVWCVISAQEHMCASLKKKTGQKASQCTRLSKQCSVPIHHQKTEQCWLYFGNKIRSFR